MPDRSAKGSLQDLRDRPAHRLLAEQGSRQPVRGSIPVFRTKYGVGLDFGHHSVKAAIVSPNKRMVLELLETSGRKLHRERYLRHRSSCGTVH